MIDYYISKDHIQVCISGTPVFSFTSRVHDEIYLADVWLTQSIINGILGGENGSVKTT